MYIYSIFGFKSTYSRNQSKIMDWNNGSSSSSISNFKPPQFFPPPRIHDHSFNLLYNYTIQDHHYPTVVAEVAEHHPGTMITNENNGFYHQHGDKKKRVTTDQLDSLEKSFQEEIKLDPDRKMRLSKDLGLPPRQVAIWFQNRRARWKAKQLENLYESLKQKFDLVSKEKCKLQQEVLALKAMLHEQAAQKKQVSKGYTDVSGEETVESTSDGNRGNTRCHEINGGNYLINETGTGTGDYNNNNHVVQPSVGMFWGVNPHQQLPF